MTSTDFSVSRKNKKLILAKIGVPLRCFAVSMLASFTAPIPLARAVARTRPGETS